MTRTPYSSPFVALDHPEGLAGPDVLVEIIWIIIRVVRRWRPVWLPPPHIFAAGTIAG